MRRPLRIYVDTSVIGGCVDEEFREDTLPLWTAFVKGDHRVILSAHTLRELQGAPESVRALVERLPSSSVEWVEDSEEAFSLAQAYLDHGLGGGRQRSDALHLALATLAKADVIVSWNFKHIVNLDRIRLVQAVNLEQGYPIIDIRIPKEVIGPT